MVHLTDTSPGTLGILAGSGSMPIHVARTAAAQRPVHVVAIRGAADDAITAFPHTWINLGQVGRMLKALQSNDCRELVIIGATHRPNFGDLRIDLGLLINLGTVLSLRAAGGDNSVLARVVAFFENKGFRVRGAHEIAPDLLAGRGCLTNRRPGRQDEEDIAVGRHAIVRLGELDVGQAVVVARSHIIAVEAAEGTDAMLERCGDLKKWGLGRRSPRSGVLVKCAKPGQDRRIDLPTIGPATVQRAADARLSGIAVAAEDVLIADRAEVVRLANRLGLFVVGVASPSIGDWGA